MQNFFVPDSTIFVTATAAFVTLKRSQGLWPLVCIFRDCETYAIHKNRTNAPILSLALTF
jgi:hypothetical protein